MRDAVRSPGTWIRLSAAVVVAMLALGARLWAVDRLPTDFDEDDYLRAGQQYATGIQAGDWSVFLEENYRPEHPPLNKIVYGFAIAPLPPAAEIPDLGTQAEPSVLPEPHRTVARLTGAVLGALGAFAMALASPFAGVFLAFQTTTVKYQAQIMLEAVASLASLLAALAYVRAARPGTRRRRAWLAAAAVLAGLAIAGKYQYGIVAVAIVVHWLWATRPTGRWGSPPAIARWVAPKAGWSALVGAAFLVGNPYLWPDPVGRLASSLAFHGGYAQGEAVAATGWPAWQPFVWLFGSVPSHEPGTFVIAADLAITALALVGLRRLWREQRVFAIWLALALAFLVVWPTKWAQYVLMIAAPLTLAAGFGFVAAVVEPGRAGVGALRARWAARGMRRIGGTRRSPLREVAAATPWILPGAIAVAFLTVGPLVFEFLMSLTDFSARSIKDGLTGGVVREAWLGLTGQVEPAPIEFGANEVRYVGFDLLGIAQSSVPWGGNTTAAPIAFSVLWTVLSIALQLALGLGIALVLARPGVRFVGAWRALFILPWAVPEFVGAIAWLKIFEPDRGWLALLVGQPIPWNASANWSLVVLLIAGTWIGWPLMMLVATAGLRTIPRAVVEAAAIDGAGRWTTFRRITWPLLLPLLGPALVIKAIAVFNQFYLFYVMPIYGTFPSDVTLATFSFFLFDPTRGSGLYAAAAAFNVLTVVALALLVAWFVRWRARAERVALV